MNHIYIITITVLISVTVHLLIAGIYIYLFPLHCTFPLFSASTSAICSLLSGSITIFYNYPLIPKESGPLSVLPKFGC